jgi:hypothetical protein
MDKMTKEIKKLKKENDMLRGKTMKSDTAIIEAVEAKANLTKKVRGTNRAAALCPLMCTAQMQMQTGSGSVGLRAWPRELKVPPTCIQVEPRLSQGFVCCCLVRSRSVRPRAARPDLAARPPAPPTGKCRDHSNTHRIASTSWLSYRDGYLVTI